MSNLASNGTKNVDFVTFRTIFFDTHNMVTKKQRIKKILNQKSYLLQTNIKKRCKQVNRDVLRGKIIQTDIEELVN